MCEGSAQEHLSIKVVVEEGGLVHLLCATYILIPHRPVHLLPLKTSPNRLLSSTAPYLESHDFKGVLALIGEKRSLLEGGAGGIGLAALERLGHKETKLLARSSES